MADPARMDGYNHPSDFSSLLSNYTGETVTIFTNSYGQMGEGFTGVILAVNNCFVRLITKIGSPPGFGIGNTSFSGFGVEQGYGVNASNNVGNSGLPSPVPAGGWEKMYIYEPGTITDIPICAIVSFVHNAV